MPQPLRGVVLTGTIGAGKTSVSEGLSGLLTEKGIRHALLDLDWLGQLYPPTDPENPYALDLAFRNLEAIAPNFTEAGARYIVIGATITNARELQQLRGSLPDIELVACRVEADPEVVAARIRARSEQRERRRRR
jgi:adenylylsulfate kinase-like enzyme